MYQEQIKILFGTLFQELHDICQADLAQKSCPGEGNGPGCSHHKPAGDIQHCGGTRKYPTTSTLQLEEQEKKKKRHPAPLAPFFFLEVVKIPVQSQKCGDGEAEIRGLILAILGAPGMRGHHLGAQSLRAMLGHSATEFLKEIIKINK